MPKCEQCGADLPDGQATAGPCPFCSEPPKRATAIDDGAATRAEAATLTEVPPPVEEAGTILFDGSETQAEAGIDLELNQPSDQQATLHGGPPDRPATHAGDASLTRFDQLTPAPPGDSNAAATVDLEQKIEKMWAGIESQGDSPSATLRVSASHLEDDTQLSVSERPIAYPETAAEDKADYRVLEFIAQGGMGRVYLAQQTSLGRRVALKTLKDDLSKKDRHRRKFLAEASITGRLDHPNIVPIHDLGVRADGVPFYSMKFVTGEPWDTSITKRSKTENVGILLQVCDAMAFAHSRQILHRDLKPENVMLGEYGEVLVADWGLAIHMERDREFALGGTPLYMSPEMANHDVPLIGVRSDIYLLGAILFEILEGKPPHSASGQTATERLLVAAMNRIEPHQSTDELIEVAIRALSTNPSDRYDTVKDFQAAIRECQRHSDSRDRSERAATELHEAKQAGENEKFARALFAYQDAIDLWPENHLAAEGLQATRLAYAENALAQHDYALGLSLLDASDPKHQPLHDQLADAQEQANNRGRRLKLARNAAVGATLATVVSLLGFGVYANNARSAQARLTEEAQHQRGIAEQKAQEATEQRDRAAQNEQEANNQRAAAEKNARDARAQWKRAEENERQAKDNAELARRQKDLANEQRLLAVQNAEAAQRRAFAAKLALTAAALAVHDTDAAKANLREIEQQYPEYLDWEGDRLRYLCHTDFASSDLEGQIVATATSPDGRRMASLLQQGQTTTLYTTKYVLSPERFDVLQPRQLVVNNPRCVALGEEGQVAVAGGSQSSGDPLIEIWRPGHATPLLIKSPYRSWTITSMAFAPKGQSLAVAHHAPLAVRIQLINLEEATAVLDAFRDSAEETSMAGVGSFESLAFSHDGQRLAAVERSSVGASRVVIWSSPTDHGDFRRRQSIDIPARSLAFSPVDPTMLACGGEEGALFVCQLDASSGDAPWSIKRYDRHSETVTHVDFTQDGRYLATASSSGVAHVWTQDLGSWSIAERPPVRHASSLRTCCWAESPTSEPTLLTCSAEGLLHAWPLDRYFDVRKWRSLDNAAIRTLGTTKDNSWLITGDDQGHTRLYKVATTSPSEDKTAVADFYVGHDAGAVSRSWSLGPQSDDVLTLSFGDSKQAGLYRWSASQRTWAPNLRPTELQLDLMPSGRYLAVAGLEGVRIVDTTSGETVAEDGLAADSIASLDSERFVVGDARGRVTVFDVTDNGLERGSSRRVAGSGTLKLLSTTVVQGQELCYAATGGAKEIFQVTVDAQGNLDSPIPLSETPGPIRSLACDGLAVAAIAAKGDAVYAKDASEERWRTLPAPGVRSIAIAATGQIAMVLDSGSLQLWSLRDTTLREVGSGFERVDLLRNGRFCALGTGGQRPRIVSWRPADDFSKAHSLRSRSPVVLTYPVPTGQRPMVATLGSDGYLRSWDAHDPRAPVRSHRLCARVHAASASTNYESMVALLERDNTRQLGATSDLGSSWTALPMPAEVQLSPSTSCAVEGNRAVAWDAAQSPPRWTLWEGVMSGRVKTTTQLVKGRQTTERRPVAISRAGLIALVTTEEDAESDLLKVFTKEGGDYRETHRDRVESGLIQTLAFSHSGARLLIGTSSGRISVRDLTSHQPDRHEELLSAEPLTSLAEHRRPVRSLRFAPDGKTLLSGSSLGETILWPVESLQAKTD